MRRRTLLAVAGGVISLSGCLSEREDQLDARGTIAVAVDGDQIDLSADRFQSEHVSNDSTAFHLHEGSDEWFMEGTSAVTVAKAINLLPHFAFERRDGDAVITIDDQTYDAGEARTTIDVRVDGDQVNPAAHQLADGERIELEISTGGE